MFYFLGSYNMPLLSREKRCVTTLNKTNNGARLRDREGD